MKKLILSIIITSTLFINCAHKYEIQRNETTFLRRMPQINKIDAGETISKGDFLLFGTGAYSISEPDAIQITDTSFNSRSSLLIGDEITTITSSNSFLYESRLIVSGEGCYAFTDLISGGASLDLSLNKIKSDIPYYNTTLNNNLFEGSVFVRLAKQYGNFAISIKPELIITSMHGEKITTEVVNQYTEEIISATSKMTIFTPAFRSTSVLRFNINDIFSLFSGFQIKSQPYLSANADLHHEIALNSYLGFETSYKLFSLSPFMAFPLGSAMNHYKSPVSIGVLGSIKFQGQ